MKNHHSGALAAILLALVATGCSPSDPRPPATAWSPPAWFAEQAQKREEVAALLQRCMDDRGWNIPIDEWGGTPQPFDVASGESDRYRVDITACSEGVDSGHLVSRTDDASMQTYYARELDIYACLKNEGIEPGTPPPFEVFSEQHSSDAPAEVWNAWNDSWIQTWVDTHTDQDSLRELELRCPQQW